jgi:hypothetical protein
MVVQVSNNYAMTKDQLLVENSKQVAQSWHIFRSIRQTQPRVVKIEGNSLHLSTASPITSGGKVVNSYLRWERATPL